MARLRRYIPDGEPTVVEVTNRTIQSRFLLRPGPELNDAILGALGRAQRLYDVEIHGFVVLSNHYHLVATVRSARQLASFIGYVASTIGETRCGRGDTDTSS